MESFEYLPKTLRECRIKESGYDEGYNDGHNKAKEIITNLDEQERQAIYQEGYDSGRNQFVNDYGFSIDNTTIQHLETTMYKKGLSDKEGINEAVKRQEFNKGFKSGVETQSFEKCSVKEVSYNDGYKNGYNDGVEDTVAEFELGNAFTDKLSHIQFNNGYELGKAESFSECLEDRAERERALQEDAWEQGFLAAVEEMTECDCDEEYSEYEFGAVEDDETWIAKDGTGELKLLYNAGDVCSVKVVTLSDDGGFYTVGDTLTIDKSDLEKHWTKKSDGSERKHSHYFKDVRHLDYVDIYMVCKLFEVNDSSHCTQHAIKKLLMSGKRGVKGKVKDITEARDTLNRYLQIIEESGES